MQDSKGSRNRRLRRRMAAAGGDPAVARQQLEQESLDPNRLVYQDPQTGVFVYHNTPGFTRQLQGDSEDGFSTRFDSPIINRSDDRYDIQSNLQIFPNNRLDKIAQGDDTARRLAAMRGRPGRTKRKKKSLAKFLIDQNKQIKSLMRAVHQVKAVLGI